MVDTCPTCGAIVSTKIFPRTKQRIFEYIAKHPDCSRTEIEDSVYRNDLNGGPDSNSFSAHICQMRPTLKLHGMNILCRSGPGATYRIVEIKAQ